MPRRRVVQEEEDANLGLLGPDFKNDVQCLLISEVKAKIYMNVVLLGTYISNKKKEGSDVPEHIAKTHEYCTKFSKYETREACSDIRRLFPVDDGTFSGFEMAQLANLGCETSEQAKLLIPSLDRMSDIELQFKLDEMLSCNFNFDCLYLDVNKPQINNRISTKNMNIELLNKLKLNAAAADNEASAAVKDNIGLKWKISLNVLPQETPISSWPLLMAKERSCYEDLKLKFIFDPSRNAQGFDPLSMAEDSPWQQSFAEIELRKIIKTDVDRTFPELKEFKTAKVKALLENVLFIWCSMNPDISYRQGMHELCAICYLAVENDSSRWSRFKKKAGDKLAFTGEEVIIVSSLFDPAFIEHDVSTIFFSLMRTVKGWYQFQASNNNLNKRNSGSNMPIVITSNRVINEYLQVLDNELFRHFTLLKIEPQLFTLKWLRLLFSREFPLDEVFILWSGIFDDDGSGGGAADLKLVEWIILALLIIWRDELLTLDYTGVLQKLMKNAADGLTATKVLENAKALRKRFFDGQMSNSLKSTAVKTTTGQAVRQESKFIVPKSFSSLAERDIALKFLLSSILADVSTSPENTMTGTKLDVLKDNLGKSLAILNTPFSSAANNLNAEMSRSSLAKSNPNLAPSTIRMSTTSSFVNQGKSPSLGSLQADLVEGSAAVVDIVGEHLRVGLSNVTQALGVMISAGSSASLNDNVDNGLENSPLFDPSYAYDTAGK